MGVLIEGGDLDRLAPFGMLCDSSLVVTRVGPSWARLTSGVVGRGLLDVFDLVRPVDIDSLAGLRRHRDSLLMRLKPGGPRLRFQVVDVSDPVGVLLVGTPVVSSSEELERLGLSAADFSPIDQTPDLLLLRRGQERNLADLRTLNTELHSTMSRLTALLAHMQTGVLVEDEQRRVVVANDKLVEIFGAVIRSSDLTGLPASAAVSHLVPGTEQPRDFLQRTEDLLRRRWPASDQKLALADGRVLEFDFQPIVSEGSDLGALWMFRDATDRVQYEQALARARDEAIAASDAKTQFLGSMSHEIRTPMHGVLATVDLLRMTGLDEEQRDLIDVLMSSASTLVEIINDILDFQRVEAGRIDLTSEPFALGDVVTGVVDLLGPQARAKGLDLRLVLDNHLPALVEGDPLRLRQVLVNLAGNAVKFTADGSVTVSAAVQSRSGGEVVVGFEVCDTGRGIAADRLGVIFDPFVQAAAGSEGTGLGLAISDRLVTLMGGAFDVRSVVGEGSSFRFSLRLPEPAQRPALDHGMAAAVDRAPGGGPRSVLVVDDSEASRNLVLRQLSRLGVAAVAVATGVEALAVLEESRSVALVLLDADMPDLDGPATTTRIRASEHRIVADVPVIGLVGEDDDWLERCRVSGMDGHLSKPVDLAELRRVVDELVRRTT